MTIEEARKYLRHNWNDGCKCPACGQHVQLYDYKLFATSAFALIELYKLGNGYHHISEYAEAGKNKQRAPHFAELRFWGLIEASTNNDITRKASGYWKITAKGEQFVKGEISVPSRILIFNNKFQGFSGKSTNIKISEALGNKFDYSELWRSNI